MSDQPSKPKWGGRKKAVAFVLAALVLAAVGYLAFREKSQEGLFNRFVERTRAAAGPRLLEGLPHQMFEGELMMQEIEKKKTFVAHTYHFYEEALAGDAELIAKVLPLLLNWEYTQPTEFTGLLRCGGFHPDYMLEWSEADGKKLQAMLCFGCGEAKLFDGDQVVYCTMGYEKELRELMKKVRKNRPEEPEWATRPQ